MKEDTLLDDLITEKITHALKVPLTGKNNNPLALYFLYHIPRFGTDSYLLTNDKIAEINFEQSFSYKKFKEYSDGEISKNQILSNIEVNDIINYALNLSEIHELLRDETIISAFGCLTKHEILYKILSIFNCWNFDQIKDYRAKPNLFQLMLKISLLSIPQFPVDSSNLTDTPSIIKGNTKEDNFDSLINRYKNNQLELHEKIFLLVTLIEGFLWTLNNRGRLMNFYVGNLFKVLSANTKGKITYNIRSHSFYLSHFKFYFYGNINANSSDVKRAVKENFKLNLSDIIQFAKSFISRLNIDSVQNWYDLSNPLIPKSIAHGITSVCLPYKIGFFEKKGNNLILVEAFEHNEECQSISQLNDPWASYGITTDFKLDLSTFNNADISANGNNQVLIKTQNATNQIKYIGIEFSNNENIPSNHSDYKYAFKAFIEKLQLIHRSASLNFDNNLWYKKAYCILYEYADKVRVDKQYNINVPGYRDWEEDILNTFFVNRDTTVIYDFGAFTGRLTDKILKSGKKKINKLYAVDQNQKYLNDLNEFISKNPHKDKVNTICCDFRNINFLFDREEEKADLICFTNTVFGYFDDKENEAVLLAAYRLLKPGGMIWIDQFNPSKVPPHCEEQNSDIESIPAFKFTNDSDENYKLVKTSNLKLVNDNYGLYYGNYMYFRIFDYEEQLVKSDTYKIKLYTEKWFKEVLKNEIYEIDKFVQVNFKDNETTMFIQIIKNAIGDTFSIPANAIKRIESTLITNKIDEFNLKTTADILFCELKKHGLENFFLYNQSKYEWNEKYKEVSKDDFICELKKYNINIR
jgi:SAM-dependent methyltransferase